MLLGMVHLDKSEGRRDESGNRRVGGFSQSRQRGNVERFRGKRDLWEGESERDREGVLERRGWETYLGRVGLRDNLRGLEGNEMRRS